MHGSAGDRRALEREALRNVIAQWNANRLDLFELSEPNEDLEFHGVMRFYFQDSGQKVATKCIRVASDATVSDVIETLIEKFRPDMRMLSVPSYALYEIHENCPERKLAPDEKPLLVQLNWHVDDREGRFLLKNIDDKSNMSSMGLSESNSSFRRKLSKREKKQLKKQEKLSRLKGENEDSNEKQDNVAEKLYTELPETSFTRSISNPEAVMRRRRQQKLERKLQQFRSKDGGPDTGGTLKIYGESLCRDVPYKTLLLSVRDCASTVVREMLDKYGLSRHDPTQWCLVQVTTPAAGGGSDQEYVLDDDECPLAILMNHSNARGSIMFHVRRRPADCAPRKRKKKPALGNGGGSGGGGTRDSRGDTAPVLVELGPDGQVPHPGDMARTLRLTSDVMEVGSANGIALQLYGPHIQPRHCVIANTDGLTSLTPCHADAHTYVNGQRIYQTTILQHGNLVKFGHSNTYQFLDPSQESRSRHPSTIDSTSVYDRSPRALSPTDATPRENYETTFDLEGNVETVSTASVKEDNRSLGSVSENRMPTIDRYPRGQDPILPAVLEFPEEPQEQFLARVISHLDVTTPSFKLAPAYTLYLCARYRASTHYRPELTPTERAHKLTLLLQHAAMLIRHTVQERRAESTSQAFWLANASELLHFLKSDRHVSAFSLQAQDTLADAVQSAFRNLVTCLTDELNSALGSLVSDTTDDHPNQIISVLSSAMSLLRKCRVNAALTIQLFSQLFHWISARSLSTIINNPTLCTKSFGQKLFNRLRNLQGWAESQGLELAAECHLAKILQCAHLLQAPKYTADELANLSSACFKLNSLQLRALLTQYKGEMGEQVPSAALIEQTARAAEGVADELTRADGREVRLHEDTTLPVQLLLPDDGFSCDVVQGVPQGLAEFLQPLQSAGLCRLAGQPTSSGHWTVYMSAPRSPSALSSTQPEVQIIRLHKAGGGMGLSIVAAKGAGQERLGIYIKSVVPGGAADLDGRLAAGDQLLSVDGQSLLGITQERAAEFLVRTGNTVALEVAKGGAVYHGLATLLQQPSPTPHRAEDYYPTLHRFRDSQDSLLHGSVKYNIFSPRQKSSGFFSSDDSLYKAELKKLTIPRISIEAEPSFNLEITDFSEPCPKHTYIIDDSFTEYPKFDLLEVKSIRKNKSGPVNQLGSNNLMPRLSVEINDIPYIDSDIRNNSDDTEKCDEMKNGHNLLSQELSSSQSSINSSNAGNQELTLDLTLFDTDDAPEKPRCWKSPDQVRLGYVKTVARHFDDIFSNRNVAAAQSEPELREINKPIQKKSTSEDNLSNKLSETERLEVFKLLQDWSTFGSDAPKSDNTISKAIIKQNNENVIPDNNEKDIEKDESNISLKTERKYQSETNISHENQEVTPQSTSKFKSESEISKIISDNTDWYTHKCQFKNCIFNIDSITNINTAQTEECPKEEIDKSVHEENEKKEKLNSGSAIKGILKNTSENITSSVTEKDFNDFKIFVNALKPFNGQLVRCDSLDNITRCRKKFTARVFSATDVRKFPESYIVTRRNKKFNSEENVQICNCLECKNQDAARRQRTSLPSNVLDKPAVKTSPKIVFLHRKVKPKTWKSCSDILGKRKPTVKKCCRYAKRTCPVFKNSVYLKRDIKSCTDIDKDTTQNKVNLCPATTIYQDNLGPRRMSERDLPSRVDSERSIPSSKSVPALHHISQGAGENGRSSHDVFNPGYSRTSSNNSINNGVQNGMQPPTQQGLRSRSTHNLNQQDAGFYQNLSVYRNKMPSPQQLGDRSSALRSSQNSLHSTNTQRPSSAYYPPSVTAQARPSNLHQSIPNLKSPPSVHRLHQEDSRSGSFPTVNSTGRPDERQPHYPSHQNYQVQSVPRLQNEEMKYSHYPGGGAHPMSPSYGNPNQRPDDIRQPAVNSYPSTHHNMSQGYSPAPQHALSPMNNSHRGHEEVMRQQPSNDMRYPQQPPQGLLREDMFRQSQQGRMDEQRLTTNGNIRPEDMRTANHIRNEDMMRYPSSNNIKSPDMQGRANEDMMRQNKLHSEDIIRNNDMMRGEMRPSKSEDMLRQPSREEMMRYNSTNNIRTQEDPSLKIDERQFAQMHPSGKHVEDMRHPNAGRSEEALKQNQNEIVRQHPVNASLRGQAKMAEMGEEVRRRQNRVAPGYNQYQPNTSNYQQYQPQSASSPYYQQSPGMNQTYPQPQQQQQPPQQQQQYYSPAPNQQQPVSQYSQQQQYQQPMSPSYTQSSSAYNQQTINTSTQNMRNYPTTPNQQAPPNLAQANLAQAHAAMQNLSLNTSYPQAVTSPTAAYNQTNFAYNSQQMSPQSAAYPKSPPTAPKPKPKLDDIPPDLPPSSTHPLYAASMQEPPKGAFYPSTTVQGKGGPAANPWEREEREKEMEARRAQARQWRDQQVRELSSLAQRSSQQEEQLRALRLEREFERRAQEAEQEDEDGEKESPPPQPPYLPQTVTATPTVNTAPVVKADPPTSILKPGAIPVVTQANTAQVIQEIEAPPPPERGSSYAIMSLRVKESTKRVSFDTSGHNVNQEIVHEDPNQFIAQAESMLASPTTPTDSMPGQPTATPGVIGAQEVYRDPRTRRLAEQAQQKAQGPIPEKLTFKEKMKMFAMETGEGGTPKDKSKISRAQREIDNLASSPSSSLVH